MRTLNGQFMSKRKQNFLFLVGLALAIWLFSALIGQGIENEKAVNAHTCAVWGYAPDCKTPLNK